VGDTTGDAEVSYELLCRRHWLAGETGRAEPDAATLDTGAQPAPH
jgi:hypothetical protein